MEEFTNTFQQFLDETHRVIPEQCKGEIIKVKWYIHLKDPQDILVIFFKHLQKHQNDVLIKNDKFIDKIRQEFPLLNVYHVLDEDSKKTTLEYLKVLYLLAYQFIEKSSRKKNECN